MEITGLTNDVAAQRLQQEGRNELPTSKSRGLWHLILKTMKEPMLLLLLATALLYLPLGEWQEGAIIMCAVLVVIFISLFQERKTENTLNALKDLSTPKALVIRGGIEQKIPRDEVVREDIIVLHEGERVPADAYVIQTQNLIVDESMLTGESISVSKTIYDINRSKEAEKPSEKNTYSVYMGTLVVAGQALAKVFATGANTELGKIGSSIQNIVPEETRLNKEIKRITKTFAIVGVGICVLLLLVYGLVFKLWLKGILSGLTLAMAMLPEEFPVVLTVFLSIGAWRMARKNVLARNIPVLETFGATTVLCSDKTGTLTMNKMKVEQLYADGDFSEINTGPLPEKYNKVLEYGILASQADAFDPMEKAIKDMGAEKLNGSELIHKNWKLVKEYPLSAELLSMTEVWQSTSSNNYIIAAKGAPEAIIDLCHLDEKEQSSILSVVSSMASNGLRVLGVASAMQNGKELSDNQHDFLFNFVGLIGLADPIRDTVPAAIEQCKLAGIKVVMITGDYPATARHIADQIGLTKGEIVTGEEISNDDKWLKENIDKISIFSRVSPIQKLEIVNALKASGEIVAMTGDGVNDAPALRAAHTGIAMGQKGTDVAREAASLVLLDDDFGSIVSAIGTGRRIFANLQKAMTYIFAIHIPIAGISLIPLFSSSLPVIFFPVHIVLLELIIDPACTIVFEAEEAEKNSMSSPPRPYGDSLFGWKKMIIAALQGIGVLLTVLLVYFITLSRHYPEDDVRTLSFFTLVIGNLSLIVSDLSNGLFFKRKWRQNKALIYMLCGLLLLLPVIMYFPPIKRIFHFSTLHADDILISIAAGMGSILWFEVFKFVRNKRAMKRN